MPPVPHMSTTVASMLSPVARLVTRMHRPHLSAAGGEGGGGGGRGGGQRSEGVMQGAPQAGELVGVASAPPCCLRPGLHSPARIARVLAHRSWGPGSTRRSRRSRGGPAGWTPCRGRRPRSTGWRSRRRASLQGRGRGGAEGGQASAAAAAAEGEGGRGGGTRKLRAARRRPRGSEAGRKSEAQGGRSAWSSQ